MNYEKDPQKIYEQSFSIIRNEVDLSCFPAGMQDIIIRIVHACGMTDITRDIRYSDTLLETGLAAYSSGAGIYCDTRMTSNGIIQSLLPANTEVVVSVDTPEVQRLAESNETTRSAASVDHWHPHYDGGIVVIGNAPTALFRLLELVAKRRERPSLVIATPVGFVGAAESKQELTNNDLGLDYITVLGRRGGSAIAASIVNALSVVYRQRLELN